MKKNIIIISLILLIILVICILGIKANSNVNKAILQQNNEYEEYLKDEIYGTEIVSLINKAINNNEANNVEKDEKGLYINNNADSIQIDIVLITDEEKGETTTYKMEAISKIGMTDFIKNFNITKFECTKKEYHVDTGRISYMQLLQKY